MLLVAYRSEGTALPMHITPLYCTTVLVKCLLLRLVWLWVLS